MTKWDYAYLEFYECILHLHDFLHAGNTSVCSENALFGFKNVICIQKRCLDRKVRIFVPMHLEYLPKWCEKKEKKMKKIKTKEKKQISVPNHASIAMIAHLNNAQTDSRLSCSFNGNAFWAQGTHVYFLIKRFWCVVQ